MELNCVQFQGFATLNSNPLHCNSASSSSSSVVGVRCPCFHEEANSAGTTNCPDCAAAVETSICAGAVDEPVRGGAADELDTVVCFEEKRFHTASADVCTPTVNLVAYVHLDKNEGMVRYTDLVVRPRSSARPSSGEEFVGPSARLQCIC